MPHPNLAEDFLDAMHRHWHDARLLEQNGRTANADHLYGVSAECGLKADLERHGHRIEGNKKLRRHLPKLWKEYVSLVDGKDAATLELNFSHEANPFDDWTIDDRYAHRTKIKDEQLQRHHSGAEKIRNMFQRRGTP